MATTAASHSNFLFEIDEDRLGAELGRAVPPLRVFNLRSLGINQERFLRDMSIAFCGLHLDPYDGKRGKVKFLEEHFPNEGKRLRNFLAGYYADTTDLRELSDLLGRLTSEDRNEFDRIGMTGRRKRAIARFMLANRGPTTPWNIVRVPAGPFTQQVGDARALVRTFHEAGREIASHPDVERIIFALAEMVQELQSEAHFLQIQIHPMFVFADLMNSGDNSPEGIHQDGEDYIVSALVIERAGITEGSGESTVYALDKETVLLRRVLQPGEGIFQADRNKLWHYVTPVREDPRVAPDFGHRSILGFDIRILN